MESRKQNGWGRSLSVKNKNSAKGHLVYPSSLTWDLKRYSEGYIGETYLKNSTDTYCGSGDLFISTWYLVEGIFSLC